MNNKDISATLYILNGFIETKKYELGIDESKLRVRMGGELVKKVMCFDRYVIDKHTTKESKIFGIPLEIDYNNHMCLEVHIVEKIPVIEKVE